MAPKDEAELTPAERTLLHEMIRDYGHARWLRGQIKWWIVWLLGLPTALLAVWKSIEELVRAVKGGP